MQEIKSVLIQFPDGDGAAAGEPMGKATRDDLHFEAPVPKRPPRGGGGIVMEQMPARDRQCWGGSNSMLKQ